MKINDLKFRLYLKKIEFIIWFGNLRKKIRIITHCNKGKHNFVPSYLKIITRKKGITKVEIDVKWKECVNCGLMVFKNKKDRDNYLIHLAKKQLIMQKLLKLKETKK